MRRRRLRPRRNRETWMRLRSEYCGKGVERHRSKLNARPMIPPHLVPQVHPRQPRRRKQQPRGQRLLTGNKERSQLVVLHRLPRAVASARRHQCPRRLHSAFMRRSRRCTSGCNAATSWVRGSMLPRAGHLRRLMHDSPWQASRGEVGQLGGAGADDAGRGNPGPQARSLRTSRGAEYSHLAHRGRLFAILGAGRAKATRSAHA